MLRTFQQAVAIVTGGGSGIGVALARELLARGAARVVLADIRLDAAQAAARELGDRATAAVLDVRDAAAFRALVDEVAAREGRIDHLFNNAGVAILGPAERHTPDDWKLVLEVNLHGVVNGVQAAYPRMIAQGFGHIVNTASIAGLTPLPLIVPYVASKHAIVALSRALRVEARDHGVRVSALCPGIVNTPLFTHGAVRTARPASDEVVRSWKVGVKTIAPEVFARAALDGVAKNRELVHVPRAQGFLVWLLRCLPGFERAVLAKELARSRIRMPEMFG